MDKVEFVALIGRNTIAVDTIPVTRSVRGAWNRASKEEETHGVTIAYLSEIMAGNQYVILVKGLDVYNPPIKSNVVFMNLIRISEEVDTVPDEVGLAAIEILPFGTPNVIIELIMEMFNVDQKTANKYLIAGIGIIILCVGIIAVK